MRAVPFGRDLRGSRGFTLVEVAVASGLFLLVVAAAFEAFAPVQVAVAANSERGDMMQRLRAVFDTLKRDLAAAGAGGATARDHGALLSLAPAVFPARLGWRAADPSGAFRRDAVTVVTAAPLPSVSTTIAQALPAASGLVRVNLGPGCPPASATCGIGVDEDVMVGDGRGSFSVYSVVGVVPPFLQLRHNGVDAPRVYPAGSPIVPIVSRTYELRTATASRPPQLIRYDGGSGPDAPVADHVVGLSFEYLGESDPPRMRRPLSTPNGPWTTYGPPPPAADTSAVPYTAGSNCVFAANGSPLAASAIPSLGSVSGALVPLTAGDLTDGPWCPDAAAPDRFDADLLRVRSVIITLRVESATASLRGPAGLLFTRGGTARAGDRYVPDIELRVRVTPPNLTGLR